MKFGSGPETVGSGTRDFCNVKMKTHTTEKLKTGNLEPGSDSSEMCLQLMQCWSLKSTGFAHEIGGLGVSDQLELGDQLLALMELE